MIPVKWKQKPFIKKKKKKKTKTFRTPWVLFIKCTPISTYSILVYSLKDIKFRFLWTGNRKAHVFKNFTSNTRNASNHLESSNKLCEIQLKLLKETWGFGSWLCPIISVFLGYVVDR